MTAKLNSYPQTTRLFALVVGALYLLLEWPLSRLMPNVIIRSGLMILALVVVVGIYAAIRARQFAQFVPPPPSLSQIRRAARLNLALYLVGIIVAGVVAVYLNTFSPIGPAVYYLVLGGEEVLNWFMPHRVIRRSRELKYLSGLQRDKLPSSWRLFKAALRRYRQNWRRYTLILSVIAVPLCIVAAIPSLAQDQLAGSYASFAAVIMNVSLVWAIAYQLESGKLPSVGQAYYDGSVLLVRFLLVSLGLVAMLIPAAFGVILFGISLLASSFIVITASEQVVLGLIAFILALPSLYLMIRYSLSLITVARENLRPMAALRASRNLTLGYFLPVTGRLILLVWWLVVLSVPISLVAGIASYIHLDSLATALFQLVSTLTALPIANLYLFELHDALADRFQPLPEFDDDGRPVEPEPVVAQDVMAGPAEPASEPADDADAPEPDPAPVSEPTRTTQYTIRRMDMARPQLTSRNQPSFGERLR